MRKLCERHKTAEVEWQGAWDEYKAQQKKVKRKIYEARVKDERQEVENHRNKGPDGIREWYNFIQGNNRSNEVQIHELVVDGCKMSDHKQMVKAVVDFWEDIGGMNEPLIDHEPATLQIGEYSLKIEDKITCVEIETFLKKVKNGKASDPDEIPYDKIFSGILNERMKHVVEEQGVMRVEQNGFRRDKCGEDKLFVVAICGNFIGVAFGWGLVMVALDLHGLRIFGSYISVLAFFHFSEYFVTAATNPPALSLDSYLLNHSLSYWLAAISSWVEFFLEWYFFPPIKSLWYVSAVGAIACLAGEVTRKFAMITAQKNFNHLVQVRRQSGHKLVTHGVYAWCRHPSYVGWFWWSIGTQVLLINPICVVFYTAASWYFFNERIEFEEMTLLNFFGQEYVDYQKQVGSGLPFIKGYRMEGK
ncbi:Isoprenylcysteine carboxyl methyltransferase [Trinorchestia longiramus]|nr:Isoprenylcysteine carboxyl methyltransferase [Trinorchestia longiramus]